MSIHDDHTFTAAEIRSRTLHYPAGCASGKRRFLEDQFDITLIPDTWDGTYEVTVALTLNVRSTEIDVDTVVDEEGERVRSIDTWLSEMVAEHMVCDNAAGVQIVWGSIDAGFQGKFREGELYTVDRDGVILEPPQADIA